MLLGSALANIGASASVVTFHSVGAREAVGEGEANTIAGCAVGLGRGTRPYTLHVVVTFRLGLDGLLPEIHVLGSLLPCRNE